MGSEIERPDWGDGERTPFHSPAVQRVPAPVDADLLPAPDDLLAKRRGDGEDATEGFTDLQIERVISSALEILEGMPDGFSQEFDKLPVGTRTKWYAGMAARPDLRGLDLLDYLEKRHFNAEDQYWAEQWLEALPEAMKEALL